MLATAPSSLCPACSALNERGSYCSQCGAPLLIGAHQFSKLLRERLARAGFEDVTASVPPIEGQDSSPSLQPESGGDPPSLFTLPANLSGRRAIATLHVLAIVPESYARDLDRLSSEVVDRAHRLVTASGALEVDFMQICVYVLYMAGAPPARLPSRSLVKPKREPLHGITEPKKPVYRVTLAPVDVSKGTARFHREGSLFFSRFESDRQVLSALGQLSPRQEEARRRSFGLQYLGSLVSKPVDLYRTYSEAFYLVLDPELLAHRIRSSISADDAVSVMSVGIIVSALISQVFRVQVGRWTNINLLNSVLDGLAVSIVGLIGATLAYLLLRAVGGRGTFRDTFVAAVFIGAVVNPTLTFVYDLGVVLHLLRPDQWDQGLGISIALAAPVYGAVHDVSSRKFFLTVFGAGIAVVVLAQYAIAWALGF